MTKKQIKVGQKIRKIRGEECRVKIGDEFIIYEIGENFVYFSRTGEPEAGEECKDWCFHPAKTLAREFEIVEPKAGKIKYPRVYNYLRINWHWMKKNDYYEDVYKLLEVLFDTDLSIKAGKSLKQHRIKKIKTVDIKDLK